MNVELIREKPMRRFTDAELMDLHADAQFNWYALQVIGGQESAVANHLAGRRFGVYVPCEVRTAIIRGKRETRLIAMLPGYIFVYSPDIEAHWWKIEGTPGALGILSDGERARAITEQEIAEVRAVENIVYETDRAATVAVYRGRKRRSRRSKRARVDRRKRIVELSRSLGLARDSAAVLQ